MGLNPLIKKYLDQMPAVPASDSHNIQEMRRAFDERQKKICSTLPPGDLMIHDEMADTSYGPTAIRIYRPPGPDAYPTLIFFHGGGFVYGNLDTLEVLCREIAQAARSIIISVDYPLAPEYPFPEAPEACYAAVKWIYDRLGKWNADPVNCFIGGSSAGATLATVVALMIKDRGGPLLSGQILLCPMTDTDFETPSYRENGIGYNLTKEMCAWFCSKYIPDPSLCTHPLISPLRALNVQGLPPALIVTAEYDPLRDEGRAYARKLMAADVDCQEICYAGMVHGFYSLPLDLPAKKDVLKRMREFINKAK
jgi:acetyl esterase